MNTILRFQKVSSSSKNLLCKIQTTSFCCYKKIHASSVPVLRGIRSPSLSVSRNFWETFPETRPVVHIKDGLDRKNHDLVFRAKLFNYAFYAQLVTMSTFVAQTVCGTYYAYQSVYHQIGPTLTHVGGIPITYDLISVMILMIFTLHNIVVYYIAQNSLLRIYHKIDTDEYVFVSLSTNPFKSRLTYCKPGEMMPLNKVGLLNLLGNYKIKERQFFLKYENFFEINHFNRLLKDHNKYE